MKENMELRADSYERLHRAIELMLQACEEELEEAEHDDDDLETVAREDDVIEWEIALRDLNLAYARAGGVPKKRGRVQ